MEKMKIRDIARALESYAPPALAESYDNVGLLAGEPDVPCTGVLINLDVTEAVVEEAAEKGLNMIVTHHPIWFTGRKRLTGEDYVSRTILSAIRKGIALYAIHTNLDNVRHGVNARMASKLGLQDCRILAPKKEQLLSLRTEVPEADFEKVREALFAAGAGHVGPYDEAGFAHAGESSFRPLEGAQPAEGEIGKRHAARQMRLEVVFPFWKQGAVLRALSEAHPYEQPSFQLHSLLNSTGEYGSGMIGTLAQPLSKADFLAHVRDAFHAGGIRYADADKEHIRKVAICGGAGSFLTGAALRAGADAFVTGDITYHKYFDNEERMLLLDIGHYESEQFTSELLYEFLSKTFPNFAVRLSVVKTNPVKYF